MTSLNSKRGLWLALTGLVLLIAGCAAPGSRIMREAESSGNWDRAVGVLIRETTEHPGDAKLWARLGEAQYRAGRDEDAHSSLNKALMLNDHLVTSHLFLGYIAERAGDFDQALWHYQVFVDRKPRSKRARQTAQRIEALRQERARAFARQAISEERQLTPARYSDSTIGVVYFRAEHLPDSLRPLAKGLAEMTVTDLSKVRALRVVERLKTEKLLRELQLSNSSAFDSTTAPRLGKLLGAARILGGDLSELSRQRLRLDPQVVSSKTGEVTLADDQVGELSQFFRMQKNMVFDIIGRLGITLTEAERDSIGRIPTESLDAFLAYSRGLDLLDRGQYDAARHEFNRARALDPTFQEARAQADQMRYFEGADVTEPASLETFSERTSSQTEWRSAPPSTDARLGILLNNTGLIRITAETPPDDGGPITPPAAGDASVIINGRFDD